MEATARETGVIVERAGEMSAAERLARITSMALVVKAALTAAASFIFWGVFERDVPMGIGNMRGTALTVLVIALPTILIAMELARRGSLGARLVWAAGIGYLAYNAVMFCFAPQFNSSFLLFTTMLALSFWSVVTLGRTFDLERLGAAARTVPARATAIYLAANLFMFASLWLQAIVPATLDNSLPPALIETGMTQNPVWVLDFAFTFQLMLIGAVLLWRRRPWGVAIGGLMLIMLTIETASIGVDQVFGHLHDPSASLAAVPIMVVTTVAGLVFSTWFLRRVARATPS